MLTVDYQPIANGGGANVETQAQFILDLANPAELGNGFIAGVAQSAQVNKVVRQSSMMTAAWANVIAQTLNINVLDDGNLPNLIAELISTIQTIAAPASTGDLKLTLKTAADAGWVLCNDGTIGNAVSGATARANADTQPLFTLLYNTFSNALCPVLPGGRGANAAADFAANKTINLTLMLGRALAIAGAGVGLTVRALGSIVGEETHLLTNAEMPTHNHGVNDPGHLHQVSVFSDGGAVTGIAEVAAAVAEGTLPTNAALTGITINASGTGVTTVANGGGGAHNNMQPTSFVNVMIKL